MQLKRAVNEFRSIRFLISVVPVFAIASRTQSAIKPLVMHTQSMDGEAEFRIIAKDPLILSQSPEYPRPAQWVLEGEAWSFFCSKAKADLVARQRQRAITALDSDVKLPSREVTQKS